MIFSPTEVHTCTRYSIDQQTVAGAAMYYSTALYLCAGCRSGSSNALCTAECRRTNQRNFLKFPTCTRQQQQLRGHCSLPLIFGTTVLTKHVLYSAQYITLIAESPMILAVQCSASNLMRQRETELFHDSRLLRKLHAPNPHTAEFQ